jgi:SAM-dependent methyltransferase
MLFLRNHGVLGGGPAAMLHFAPEYCFRRCFRAIPDLTYIAADLDPPPGGVRIDITDIPLPDDSVDYVICSHVLEHVADDARAMQELRRVLRSTGMALVMGPVDYERRATYEDQSIVTPKARLAAFHQSDHVRIYGADFDERLRTAGFRVDANRYALSLGAELAERHGLASGDIIYVCK